MMQFKINYLEEYNKRTEPRPSGFGATFIKYGREIDIHDFIQEGRDGTEIQQIIERSGGIDKLKAAGITSDTSGETVDMSINLHQAQKIMKVARIAEQELQKKLEMQEKSQETKKQEELENGGTN